MEDAASEILQTTSSELTLWLLKISVGEESLFGQVGDESDQFDARIKRWIASIAHIDHGDGDTLESMCNVAEETYRQRLTDATNHYDALEEAAESVEKYDSYLGDEIIKAAKNVMNNSVIPLRRTTLVFKCLLGLYRCSRDLLIKTEYELRTGETRPPSSAGIGYGRRDNVLLFSNSLKDIIENNKDDALCERLTPLVGSLQTILSHL